MATLANAALMASAAEPRTLRVGVAAASIAATVAIAREGDTVVVPLGVWREHVVVDRRIVLRGEPGAEIDGGGRGTVLSVSAAGAVVEDLGVRGSGTDLSRDFACVLLGNQATGATLRRLAVRHCAFGIYIDRTSGARVLDSEVIGSREGPRSSRGNGIHLFDASRLEIRGNRISGGRDGIYVTATEDSLIAQNVVEHSRYCVHYMFSYRNRLLDNRCSHNAEGYALMGSNHITVRRNVASDNTGRGMLFRDAQDCVIVGNRLERNGEGLFFYSSTENLVSGNIVRNNRVGARVWAGSVRNTVHGNQFEGNQTHVFYVGAQDLRWGKGRAGNFWSDYLGWDQDGDGVGDRPYRINSFQTGLIARFPAAALLMRSPAMELLSLFEARMPLLRTPTIVDPYPMMHRPLAPPTVPAGG